MVKPLILAAVCLAVLLAGCGGRSPNALPADLPSELGGLEVRAAPGSRANLTSEDAVAAARQLLHDEGPQRDPETFLTRVSGTVFGERPLIVTSQSKAFLPTVRNRLAWLLLWRGIERQEAEPPGLPIEGGSETMDLVIFVDARTGEMLKNVRLFGINRLP